MGLALSGTTLFAANTDSGVFRSTNYGTTWQLVDNGLVGSSRRAWWLLAAQGLVFVVTDSGLYASKDNGASWVLGTDNLALIPPMAVVGDYLFTQGTYGLIRQLVNNFIPEAQATALLNGPGTYSFNPTGNVTGVTLNLTSTSPYATQLEVKRFADAALNPSFSGSPPTTTSGYRWVITSSLAGYTVTGQIRISLSAFGSGVSDPASIKIYKRSTSGTGTFVEIPTTYEVATNELVGTITGFSEFIFGGPGGALDVQNSPAAPPEFALEQNFPNPFNPTTVISYQLPAVSDVRLVVYDMLGREVAILVNEKKTQGKYDVRFDATGLASGVYFYRLVAGKFIQTHKMAHLK
jgi:hypothetical protein